MRLAMATLVAILVFAFMAADLGFSALARAASSPAVSPAGQRAGTPLSAVAQADRAAVDRAEAAMAALSSRLIARLSEALKAAGAGHAVTVCRDEAPEIAAAVGREMGVTVGRASHRLRNPKNVPPLWAAQVVTDGDGKAASAVTPLVFDLGSRIGVIKPIGTIDLCTRCHGAAGSLDPAVRAAIAEVYPDDRATGFNAGDLRGWIWAEVRRPPR